MDTVSDKAFATMDDIRSMVHYAYAATKAVTDGIDRQECAGSLPSKQETKLPGTVPFSPKNMAYLFGPRVIKTYMYEMSRLSAAKARFNVLAAQSVESAHLIRELANILRTMKMLMTATLDYDYYLGLHYGALSPDEIQAHMLCVTTSMATVTNALLRANDILNREQREPAMVSRADGNQDDQQLVRVNKDGDDDTQEDAFKGEALSVELAKARRDAEERSWRALSQRMCKACGCWTIYVLFYIWLSIMGATTFLQGWYIQNAKLPGGIGSLSDIIESEYTLTYLPELVDLTPEVAQPAMRAVQGYFLPMIEGVISAEEADLFVLVQAQMNVRNRYDKGRAGKYDLSLILRELRTMTPEEKMRLANMSQTAFDDLPIRSSDPTWYTMLSSIIGEFGQRQFIRHANIARNSLVRKTFQNDLDSIIVSLPPWLTEAKIQRDSLQEGKRQLLKGNVDWALFAQPLITLVVSFLLYKRVPQRLYELYYDKEGELRREVEALRETNENMARELRYQAPLIRQIRLATESNSRVQLGSQATLQGGSQQTSFEAMLREAEEQAKKEVEQKRIQGGARSPTTTGRGSDGRAARAKSPSRRPK